MQTKLEGGIIVDRKDEDEMPQLLLVAQTERDYWKSGRSDTRCWTSGLAGWLSLRKRLFSPLLLFSVGPVSLVQQVSEGLTCGLTLTDQR